MHVRFVRHPLAAALGFCVLTATAQVAPPTADGPTSRIVPLEVVVNGAKSGVWLLLERDGVLYAPRDAFEAWRVQLPPDGKSVDYQGQRHWPLSAVAGFEAKHDLLNQSVDLAFSPQAFAASRLARDAAPAVAPSPVLPSAFLNYDLNYAATSPRGGATVRDAGLLAEIGASTSWGVLTSSFVGRNLTNAPALGAPRSFLRLETTATRDFPDRNRTLRLGDTTTRGAMWGRDVYYGGVRFGTNFALSPGFVSRPLPTLNGLSGAPSTVELYVDDVLRRVSEVPTGPFTMDNLPGLTGSGEARLVVRDLLGRETVIVQPFFTSTYLLAPGLNDWSVEAGKVRRDLGTASAHYGQGFAAGTLRHGYSDSVTLESRLEAGKGRGTFGFGGAAALPGQMLGKAGLVASREPALGTGGMWLLGLERQSRRVGVNFQAQGASAKFRQLGENADFIATRLQIAASATYDTRFAGVLGAAIAGIHRHDGSRISTASANYSLPLGQHSSVALNVSRAFGGSRGTAFGVNFVLPLGVNRVATVTANSHEGRHDLYATAMQTPGAEGGLGWRVMAGQLQEQPRGEAGVYYQGRYAAVSLDGSASREQTTVRAGVRGGAVLADGNFFVTERVDQSFAVAEVPGYADVSIGLGSNVLSRTNAAGVALIPRLTPYQANSVRIDPRELPVSAEIETIELPVVPAWRSAVKVLFPVRGGRAALLRIVMQDGEPAPAGAVVQIAGDTQEFYVARRGEAFVTGLQPVSSLRLHWKGRQCQFEVTLPAETPDAISRVGPLACTGVAR